jgi:hypothetical protein
MPYFTTFDDPVFDLGGKGNTTPPPRWKRPILAALICSLKGHNWQLVGYANAHKFQWTQWQIGEYRGCQCCHQRRFDLASQEQFDEVLRMERERWEAHFAKARAEDQKLISEALR